MIKIKGGPISIEINSEGNPVITYYSFFPTRIKLAVCGDPTCTFNNSIIEIDSDTRAGDQGVVLQLNDNNAFISYYNAKNADWTK